MAVRTGALALSLVVAGGTDVGGALRRVRLTSDVLRTMEYKPGQDLMFSIPVAGGTVRRRYTIRRLDRAAGAVDVDIVRHGDGPGARWARSPEWGSRIEAVGPRGGVTVDASARWHLFVGDESFAPAAFAMAEAVPADQERILVLEVDEAGDCPREISGSAGETPADASEMTDDPTVWVYRHGRAPGKEGPLLDAVRTVGLPPGPGHVYLGGEAGMVSAAKAALVERGVPADAISAKAYWRLGSANAAHGEPNR